MKKQKKGKNANTPLQCINRLLLFTSICKVVLPVYGMLATLLFKRAFHYHRRLKKYPPTHMKNKEG